MRQFIDERYPDEVVTESVLLMEYEQSETRYDGVTFNQFIQNCLARNGGTLTEITVLG